MDGPSQLWMQCVINGYFLNRLSYFVSYQLQEGSCYMWNMDMVTVSKLLCPPKNVDCFLSDLKLNTLDVKKRKCWISGSNLVLTIRSFLSIVPALI